jgi:MYXO-CTERM domain-containing protein
MLKLRTCTLVLVLGLAAFAGPGIQRAEASIITESYAITDPGIAGWQLIMSFTGDPGGDSTMTQSEVTNWTLQAISPIAGPRWNFTYSNTTGNVLSGLNINTSTGQLVSLHVDRSSTRPFASGAGGADAAFNLSPTGYHAIYVGAPSEFGGGNQVWQSNTGSFNGSSSESSSASATTPEPATLAIWGGLGLVGLVAARRRKKLAA